MNSPALRAVTAYARRLDSRIVSSSALAIALLGPLAHADDLRGLEVGAGSEGAKTTANQEGTTSPKPSEGVAAPDPRSERKESQEGSEPSGAEAKEAPLRSLISRAIRVDQDYADARALADAGEYARANELLDDVFLIDPEFDLGLELRARLLRELGRFDEAIAWIEKLESEYPSHFGFRRERGLTLEAKGELDAALEALAAPIPRPQWPEVHFARARILAKLKRFDEAAGEIERAARWGFADASTLEEEPAFHKIRDLDRFIAARALIERRAKINESRTRDPAYGLERSHEALVGYTRSELVDELVFSISKRNRRLMNYSYPAIDGTRLESSAFDDRFQIVFLWAHWSTKSVEMIEHLVALEEKFRDQGLSVILIAVDHFGEGENFHAHTKSWLETRRITLPAASVDGRDGVSRFHASDVPRTFFVGKRNGRYMYAPGPLDATTLEVLAETLIREETKLESENGAGAGDEGARSPTEPDKEKAKEPASGSKPEVEAGTEPKSSR
jgi:tetratricopeptide (TPR) repeat protein